MRKHRVKIIIGTLLVIAVIGCTIAIQMLSNAGTDNTDLLSSRYKKYDGSPPTLSMRSEIPGMSEIIEKTDAIIVGEVIGNLEDYKIDLGGAKGSPEAAISEKYTKQGIEGPSAGFIQTKVKVLDSWRGNVNQDKIVVIQNKMFAGYEPELEKGMKAVFFLVKGREAHEGRYWFSKYGFYYIADNNRVVSAVSKEEYEKYTGKKLGDLKREIVKSFPKN